VGGGGGGGGGGGPPQPERADRPNRSASHLPARLASVLARLAACWDTCLARRDARPASPRNSSKTKRGVVKGDWSAGRPARTRPRGRPRTPGRGRGAHRWYGRGMCRGNGRGGGYARGVRGQQRRALRDGNVATCAPPRARPRSAPGLTLRQRDGRDAGQVVARPHPPTLRTKRTRRVPHPVLIGRAASLTPY
jgi:hypothetical protein